MPGAVSLLCLLFFRALRPRVSPVFKTPAFPIARYFLPPPLFPYDFKGSDTSIERKDNNLTVVTDDELKFLQTETKEERDKRYDSWTQSHR